MEPKKLLLTGFGPFLSNDSNPSQRLVEASGLDFEVLEVSFKAVDSFIDGLDPDSFDSWLAVGLAGKSKTILLETVAHNRIGKTPDVLGDVQGPGPVDAKGPSQIASNLWPTELLGESETRKPSTDAGGYLCNYLLYRALQKFPNKRIGFLHIPQFEHIPFDAQILELKAIISELS